MPESSESQDRKRMTKSQLVEAVAQESGLSKKQANAAIEGLDKVVAQQLDERGEVSIPGLVKLNVVIKPATPEREGINPFTKQPTTFKAKPERKVVKARVFKGLRDSLGQGTGTRATARAGENARMGVGAEQ
jgi:DNA-binding protein HU-beta